MHGIFVRDGCSFEHEYKKLLEVLAAEGTKVQPRNMETTECLNVVSCGGARTGRWLFIPQRGINYAYAIAETYSFLCCLNSVSFLSFYNSNIAKFSDDGKQFHGHYGERFSCQYHKLTQQLKADPFSRRAMLCTWESDKDLYVDTKDVPCNLMLHYMVRDGGLHCTVFRRSSDLILGVPYDRFFMRTLQDLIANELNVTSSRYIEHSVSLHYYTSEPALPRLLGWMSGQGENISPVRVDEVPYPCASLSKVRGWLPLFLDEELSWRRDQTDLFRRVTNFAETTALRTDLWNSNAVMLLGAYHAWKAGQFDTCVRLGYHLSCYFRNALYQTLENRLDARKGLDQDARRIMKNKFVFTV